MPKTGNDAGFKPIDNSILPYRLSGKAKKANHAVVENPSLKNPANASKKIMKIANLAIHAGLKPMDDPIRPKYPKENGQIRPSFNIG